MFWKFNLWWCVGRSQVILELYRTIFEDIREQAMSGFLLDKHSMDQLTNERPIWFESVLIIT